MQIGENSYRNIYCHNDGYLRYNGKVLAEHYTNPGKIKELLDLGDISSLGSMVHPVPNEPHTFDGERQDDVVIAYKRDRGEDDVDAKISTLKELGENVFIEYVYIFTKENEWKYFVSGHYEDLKDLKEDLTKPENEPEDDYGDWLPF
jgi:hypothetical protein